MVSENEMKAAEHTHSIQSLSSKMVQYTDVIDALRDDRTATHSVQVSIRIVAPQSPSITIPMAPQRAQILSEWIEEHHDYLAELLIQSTNKLKDTLGLE